MLGYAKITGALQAATVYKLEPGMPRELAGGQDIYFEEPAYSMGAGAQGDFDSPVLRLRYSSLSTPSSTIDYNMRTSQRCSCLPSLPRCESSSRGLHAPEGVGCKLGRISQCALLTGCCSQLSASSLRFLRHIVDYRQPCFSFYTPFPCHCADMR